MRPWMCALLSLVWLLEQASPGWASSGLQRGLPPISPTATQPVGRRVALVIGNSNYDHNLLKTPKNDAEDIGAALRNLGFDVIINTNLSKSVFEESLERFSAAAQNAEIGLFFYAGFTAQYDGNNFLLATDTVIDSDAHLTQRTAVPLYEVNRALSNFPGAKVMILDASRDIPLPHREFQKSIGNLARIPSIGDDSVIVLSAGANESALDGEGRNSSFSKVLVNQLKQPGHQDLMNLLFSVVNKVKDNTLGKQNPEIQINSVSGSHDLDLSDTSEWNIIKNAQDPNALRDFVLWFPNSVFRDQAYSLAKELEREQYCSDASRSLGGIVDLPDQKELERLTQKCPALKGDIDQVLRSRTAWLQPAAAAQANDTTKQAAFLDQAETRAQQAEGRAREAEARMHEAEAQLQSAKGEALRIEVEAKVREAEILSRQAAAEALVKEAERKQKEFDLQTANAALPAIPNQGRRVALIIGNSAYRSVSMLPNPKSDATAIADALKAVGFTAVTLAEDLTLDQMRKALREFKIAADGADWAMVYYAGHGIEIGGRNYLLPVDARLESDSDVDDEAVPLQYVLDKIHNAHNLKLVILDACRENPFSATMKRQTASRTVVRGLAPYEPQIASELIFYAAKDGEQAQDGDVNGHSPFAHALIARLATPRIEINKLFRLVTSDVLQETGYKQRPFVYGSTPGDIDFYFRTE